MEDTNRSIFRAAATRHYMQGRERSVLPQVISPRAFLCLWILIGIFLCAGFVAWFTRVPVFVSGSAVVAAPSDNKDVWMVAFLPRETLSHLRVGQNLLLKFDESSTRLSLPIVAVETQISSPDAAQRRFNLNARASAALVQPAAVAVAKLEPLLNGLPTSAYVGSIYHVDVEVGSRRVLSLLPLAGRLFGE